MNIKRKSGEIWAQSWIIMIIIGGKKKKGKNVGKKPKEARRPISFIQARP